MPQTPRSIPDARRRLTRALAAALILLAVAPGALADAVKLSGFWIENVTIHKIDDGKVIYLGPAGSDIEASLDSLEGLKLDAYPQLAQGLDAAEAGDVSKGIEALNKVYREAKEPWLKRFVEWKLTGLYNRQNDGPNAIRFYLALVKAKAHGAYLDNPPINAAAAVPADQAEALVEALNNAAAGAGDEIVKGHLETLADLIAVPESRPDAPDEAGDGAAPEPGEGRATVVAGGDILLPANPPDSPTVALLRQGQLGKALESAKREVQVPGGLPEKLFYKGLIERAIADAAGDDAPDREQLYKDAGLSFMRVVIHYPKSRFAPLALLEAGYIHAQIGQDDQAAKLYAEAADAITPEDYPEYHPRLLALTGDQSDTP